jgi:hypothetical protein
VVQIALESIRMPGAKRYALMVACCAGLAASGCRSACRDAAPSFQLDISAPPSVAAQIARLKIEIAVKGTDKGSTYDSLTDALRDGSTSIAVDLGAVGRGGFAVRVIARAFDGSGKQLAQAAGDFSGGGDACNSFRLALGIADAGVDRGRVAEAGADRGRVADAGVDRGRTPDLRRADTSPPADQASVTPCQIAVAAGQHYCLDANGTMFVRHDKLTWNGQQIADSDIKAGSWELDIWFDFGPQPGFSGWWAALPLKFRDVGIAVTQLPASLPSGLCPQVGPAGQRHPFRVGGARRAGTDINDGTTYAWKSQNAADYQPGLVATGLPDETGYFMPQQEIAFQIEPTSGKFLPAAVAAKADMFGAKVNCAP